MAKKRQKTAPKQPERKSTADYYKLHTKEVDDLTGATKENTPVYSAEELRRYRSKGGLKLPERTVAFLIKAWFAGAVCFFIFWGLGGYLGDMLDMLVVFGAALGLVIDLLENSIFHFYEKTPGYNDKWMMFPQKSYAGFVFNFFYGYLLLFCTYTWYQFINGLLVLLLNITDRIPLGVEPLLFGVFFAAIDMLLVEMKHLLRRIVADAKKKPV